MSGEILSSFPNGISKAFSKYKKLTASGRNSLDCREPVHEVADQEIESGMSLYCVFKVFSHDFTTRNICKTVEQVLKYSPSVKIEPKCANKGYLPQPQCSD